MLGYFFSLAIKIAAQIVVWLTVNVSTNGRGDVLEKGLIYIAISMLAFGTLYIVNIAFAHILEPLLKSRGMEFGGFLFSPGEVIMYVAYRASFVLIGIFMGLILWERLPFYFYLAGHIFYFILLLFHSPQRMQYHGNNKLYFWFNWIGYIMPRDSMVFSAVSQTLLVLGISLIPYIISKAAMNLIT